MGNNYFQFKQFIIYQDACAMKVTTDACLFGAWAAALMNLHNGEHLLDIGTGTGLLSLMAAQKNICTIDAVEIEDGAYIQACANVAAAPGADSIKIIKADIRHLPVNKKYNCIISNPPFFEGQLASPVDERKKALHAQELSLHELLTAIGKHMHPQGNAFLLMPSYRKDECMAAIALHGFFPEQIVMVKQTLAHKPFRFMLQMGCEKTELTENEITIRQADNTYTPAFRALLQDYYLQG